MKKRTPSSPVQAPASTTDENNLKPGEGEQNSTSCNIEALQAIAPNVMVEIGRVISHIGTAGFFLATQQLVDSTVAIDGMHVSVWKVDAHARRFIDGAPLYGSELVDAGIRKGLPEALITQLVDQKGPQLIRLQPEAGGSSDLLPPAHRCLIAMRQPDSLLIVLLQRNIDSDDFSPNELAALEELSLVLLPLVEQHASL
ncbi:hypothetical protein [Paraburkholderia megapolitana]|uniref:GAF domain-containing protein n=1 Tax=Paraburkholderia megapolitana TaxID=420953 RepID=A0A1I3E1R1_9BURK|nr:hypothetical protein [Paraburkholderia megapolitana]QDQ79880.1 hypothetical protein FNZ07_01100 [Paraburkholderia megapolitana]SFH92924.1 hypothetical protein SAMN05192543_101642 [Paraburkholderia megapolitana]